MKAVRDDSGERDGAWIGEQFVAAGDVFERKWVSPFLPHFIRVIDLTASGQTARCEAFSEDGVLIGGSPIRIWRLARDFKKSELPVKGGCEK